MNKWHRLIRQTVKDQGLKVMAWRKTGSHDVVTLSNGNNISVSRSPRSIEQARNNLKRELKGVKPWLKPRQEK